MTEKRIDFKQMNLDQIRISDEYAEKIEKEEKQKQKRNQLIKSIPEGYLDKTFDTFLCDSEKQREVLEKFKSFSDYIKNGEFISVCCLGAYGIGKTHLACAVMNDIIQNGTKKIYGYDFGMSANYATSENIRERWEHAKRFDSKETQSEVIENYCDSDLLVIDEIGRSNNPETEKEILYQIIDLRDRRKKSSFYLSNLKFEEFAKLLGGATMDRLKNSAVFPSFEGLQSHRGK